MASSADLTRRGLIVVVAVGLVCALPATALASDGDSDRVEDDVDNCQGSANPLQFDVDGNGRGDVCEDEFPISDDFAGTPGSDLMFGSFRDSRLSGGSGSDSLYGEAGNDVLDGGPGRDNLVGGPGDDTIRGGSDCDIFAVETRIEHTDVFVDFTPGVDRIRIPPVSRNPVKNRLPIVVVGGTEHLEVRFLVGVEPVVTVVFEGIDPSARLILSTEPCGSSSPPVDLCPKGGARRTAIYVGIDRDFCDQWARPGYALGEVVHLGTLVGRAGVTSHQSPVTSLQSPVDPQHSPRDRSPLESLRHREVPVVANREPTH